VPVEVDSAGTLLFCGMQRLLLALLVVTAVPSLYAQAPGMGTVLITVRGDAGPLVGALVRAESLTVSGTTDRAGRVRLTLPAGRRALLIGRIGYAPKRLTLTISEGAEVQAGVTLEAEEIEVEALVVSAARTERLAGETPTRVEVTPPEEVNEKTGMSPGGIAMLLTESNGIRVQPTSPSLGTGSVRIQGLPGQYTAMLADGLPLYGGASSSLGPLSISPVDLARVEVIKGAASALYGGQALGGVINLISRPPTGRSEILVNHTSRDITDGAAWLSRRFSPASGASLLISATEQGQQDLNADGWTDQAEMRRFSVRPRFNYVDSSGRALFVTAGFGYDDRTGGSMPGRNAPDGFPFYESLESRRADLGVSGRLPFSATGFYAIRAAASTNGRDRQFAATSDAETDRSTTGFLEVTRSTSSDIGATVIGVALQEDRHVNELNDAYDHAWWTPSLFVTSERDVGPVTVSASARMDMHPEAGTRITERLAFLVRPAEEWSVRLSGGTGFAPATAQIEETEGVGLRQVRPGSDLRPERSLGTTLDIAGKMGPMEILLTAFGSRIERAVQLADAGDLTHDGILVNAAGPTRTWGAEAISIWHFPGGNLISTYGVTYATRTNPETGVREDVPLLPRQRAGLDLMLEKAGNYLVGIEGFWYGEQVLSGDPSRTRSKPYIHGGFIAMKRFGAWEGVFNIENLFDVRQTDHEPLLRPTPTTGGAWTVDAWAPLDGINGNVAVRYRW
jgi:outer membrane receptor for ferrienterochelin and colicins